MARKKQPVDVEVLRKVMEIKGLERTLKDDNPTHQESEKLIPRHPEFTDKENESFVERYIAFVNNYIDEVISERLQSIYDENVGVLDGTPEGRYVKDLIKSVGKVRLRQGEDAYDIKIEDLDFSVRAANCLKNDGIQYVGQLIQKPENEMLRSPNFGRKSLNEAREILEKYGLRFGMEIDYISPEGRDNQ